MLFDLSMSKQLKDFDVSVIIPVNNGSDYVSSLLKGIESQTLLPKEIVIMDSGTDSNVTSIIRSMNGSIPIIYKKIDMAYPGDARNMGVEAASGEWIAFVDQTTIPENNWLEKCSKIVAESNADFVGGLTLFEADTYFKELLRATSYGCTSYGTLPGSIVKKEVFNKSGGFIPSVRSSEDIEWRERIISMGVKTDTVKEVVTKHYGLPDNLWSAVKKYYKFAMATAQTDVFKRQKNIYMSTVLILLTIVVYKWNKVVTLFNQDHILYIPHITKIYFGSLVAIYIIFKCFLNPWNLKVKLGVFEKVYLVVLVALTTGLFHKWNYIFTNFNVHSIFYIPHITKIYLGSVFLLAMIYRGIIKPLRNKVKWSFLFPFRWILVGLVGVTLDIVKAPGYILGAILEITGKSARKKAHILQS